jgi:hypothetical protein
MFIFSCFGGGISSQYAAPIPSPGGPRDALVDLSRSVSSIQGAWLSRIMAFSHLLHTATSADLVRFVLSHPVLSDLHVQILMFAFFMCSVMFLCGDSFVVMHTSALKACYLAAFPVGTLATQDSESLQLLVQTEVCSCVLRKLCLFDDQAGPGSLILSLAEKCPSKHGGVSCP